MQGFRFFRYSLDIAANTAKTFCRFLILINCWHLSSELIDRVQLISSFVKKNNHCLKKIFIEDLIVLLIKFIFSSGANQNQVWKSAQRLKLDSKEVSRK
jgi:hypothetical protein